MRPATLAALAVCLLAVASLAGCVGGALGGLAEAARAVPSSALRTDPAAAAPAEPRGGDPDAVLVPGTMLAWAVECPCPSATFLALPASGGARSEWMDVRVAWDGARTAGFDPALTLPDERTRLHGERGFDDRVVRVWGPGDGRYRLDLGGHGEAQVTVRLGSTEVPAAGDRLPNLVELVIEGPHIGPCDDVERTEQGAVKCLRFGNGVGNPGHGPMQIRLTLEQGASALATLGGRFVQEVRLADGTLREREVGPATFHPTHSHWHYDGFALFELYEVDPATGLRGELASSHHKSGFCFLDWDRMPENSTEPAERERAETDCLVPGLSAPGSAQPPAWTNGISRGWYDFYEEQLTDQYVDVDGLPAGVYELVATADPLHTLDELDDADNQSSLLLRLDGDAVEVLEERAHYRVQPDDDH